MSTLVETISEKLARGVPLQRRDALTLWESKDLVSLGMLADSARRKRHGGVATFLRVFEVPAEAAADATVPATAGEVRVQGAAQALESRFGAIRALVERAGAIPVTAGALDDLEAAAGSAAELRRLLDRLRGAGVCAVASAAVDRLREPDVAVRAARDANLDVARFVVAQPDADGPWDVLDRMQAVHRATGAVRAFAPLARSQEVSRPTTGYWDVKVVAVSRLVLDRVPTIQVDWSLHGPKLAQVALLFGADDVDAVSTEDETGSGRRRAPREEIVRNIHAASLTPVERDGRFAARAAP